MIFYFALQCEAVYQSVFAVVHTRQDVTVCTVKALDYTMNSVRKTRFSGMRRSVGYLYFQWKYR